MQGAQEGLDLVARALLEPGDAVALEDPGWFGARLAFAARGAHLVGVPVDGEGLRTDALARVLRGRRVKLIYATPAVQAPTGVALADERRSELLALAEEHQCAVVEDDYDGELRLGGPASPALARDDAGGRVVTLGTFSKALFPALRVGYLVAPPPVVRRLTALAGAAHFGGSLVVQAALAELLASGALERHVRRLRRLYAERLDAMLAAVAAHLPPGTRCARPAGGTCVWPELPPGTDAAALAAAAREEGIAITPGDAFRLEEGAPPALHLGFAGHQPDALAPASRASARSSLDPAPRRNDVTLERPRAALRHCSWRSSAPASSETASGCSSTPARWFAAHRERHRRLQRPPRARRRRGLLRRRRGAPLGRPAARPARAPRRRGGASSSGSHALVHVVETASGRAARRLVALRPARRPPARPRRCRPRPPRPARPRPGGLPMRLAPVDRPPTLLARVMSFMTRRMLGKEITPARVIYNRMPRMWNVSWALVNLDLRGYTLPEELRLLLHVRISMLNGCAFCQDIALARAVQQRVGLEKFRALDDWRASPLFSDRERAALAFAEEATQRREVADATFDELRKHFGEREIVELTVENAVSNFYNLLNVPLGIEEDGLLALAERRAARAN